MQRGSPESKKPGDAMIALSIFLRQRGSSESKPVGAPHHESAVSGE